MAHLSPREGSSSVHYTPPSSGEGPSRSQCQTRLDVSQLLPIDVLAYVLSFIGAHPRLFVLSFVDKRWRSAVVRSVVTMIVKPHTYIDSCTQDMPRCQFDKFLAYFPYVSSVCFSECDRGIALPSTLTELRLRGSEDGGAFCPPYPSLNSIRLTHYDGHSLAPLLSASVYTLTRLDLLPIRGLADDELSKPLKSLYFPNLRFLKLSMTYVPVQFLSAHASQLTCLTLKWAWTLSSGYKYIDAALSQIEWPNLVKLSFIRPEQVSGPLICQLLRNSPVLQEFACAAFNEMADMPQPLLSSLRKLRLSSKRAYPDIANYFSSLKSLGWLALESKAMHDVVKTAIERGRGDLITSFSYHPGQFDETILDSAVEQCTRLEALYVHSYSRDFFPKSTLPYLTRLTLRGAEEQTPAFVLGVARHALRCCPALVSFNFDVPRLASSGVSDLSPPIDLSEGPSSRSGKAEFVAAVREFIEECKRRGLEQVHCNDPQMLLRSLRQLSTPWTRISVSD